MLDRWAQRRAGRSRTRLVTVPPSGADPQLLWQRFVSACGIDASGCRPRRARRQPVAGHRDHVAAAAGQRPCCWRAAARRPARHLLKGVLAAPGARADDLPATPGSRCPPTSRTSCRETGRRLARRAGEVAATRSSATSTSWCRPQPGPATTDGPSPPDDGPAGRRAQGRVPGSIARLLHELGADHDELDACVPTRRARRRWPQLDAERRSCSAGSTRRTSGCASTATAATRRTGAAHASSSCPARCGVLRWRAGRLAAGSVARAAPRAGSPTGTARGSAMSTPNSRPRHRVYLHIGAAKTGTTYLQGLLWHHRDAAGADRGATTSPTRPASTSWPPSTCATCRSPVPADPTLSASGPWWPNAPGVADRHGGDLARGVRPGARRGRCPCRRRPGARRGAPGARRPVTCCARSPPTGRSGSSTGADHASPSTSTRCSTPDGTRAARRNGDAAAARSGRPRTPPTCWAGGARRCRPTGSTW